MIDLTRRDFGKIAAAFGACLLIPKAVWSAPEQPLTLNSAREYGNALPLFAAPSKIPPKTLEYIVKSLIKDARETVGRGRVVEIKLSGSMDWGRNYQIAWYTNPKIAEQHATGLRWPTSRARQNSATSLGFIRI